MPGTTEVNMHTLIRWGKLFNYALLQIVVQSFASHLYLREDLPTDLTLNLDLHKITPFPMTVPCLNGVGSCEYEVLGDVGIYFYGGDVRIYFYGGDDQ